MIRRSLWLLCIGITSVMRADIVVNIPLNLTGFAITPSPGSSEILPGVVASQCQIGDLCHWLLRVNGSALRS